MEDLEVNLKEISLEALEHFKKNDYLKLFKKPTTWKKKKGVIFIAKYKFPNGKLPVVAIPFKKFNEAYKAFKDKVKPQHAPKYILLGELQMVKEEDGNVTVEVTPKMGGADIEMAAAKLFSKMKLGFRINGEQTDEQIAVQQEQQEELSPERLEKLKKKKANRLARYAKISENLSKVEHLFHSGNLNEEQIQKIIEKLNYFSDQLSLMLEEVYADGVVDQEEEAKFSELDLNIQDLLSRLEEQDLSNAEQSNEQAHLAQIKAKFVNYVKAFKTAFLELQQLENQETSFKA